MNRIELTTNIRNYIELNKALVIPYVGLLCTVRKSAEFNKQEHLAYPPESTIEIVRSAQKEDESFIDFLSASTQKSMTTCREEFFLFGRSLNADLDILGKAEIPHLGTFTRVEGKTKFFNKEKFTSGVSYGLPQIKISPLDDWPQEDAVKNSKTPSAVPYREGRMSRKIINVAASAAILALLIVGYKYINQMQFFSSEGDSLTKVEVDQKRLNKNPEKVLISSGEAELIPGTIEKGTKEASCALILGSFSKKENAVSLQNKILLTNYELYTEEFHEFYRIGISFDCSEVSASIFKQVEQDFGVDPWLRIAIR